MEMIGRKIRDKNFFQIFAYFVFIFFILCGFSLADELLVEPSSTEVGKDENLSVDFTIKLTGDDETTGEVSFDAPDFERVNQYSQGSSTYTSVTMDSQNGTRMTTTRSNTVTYVFLPKKTGALRIRNIRVKVGNKNLTAPDLVIQVSSQAQQPSRPGAYGQQGAGVFPRGGVRNSQDAPQNRNFFLRTEPDKLKIFKGEQVIVTYALYTQVPITGIQVERYPSLNGFLKEEISVPVLKNDLDFTPTVVNGKQYHRAVLAQYAAYPLKEGLNPLDTFTGKFGYQSNSKPQLNIDDDPFQIFGNFMRSMRQVAETKSSDRVSIEVLPLPASEQPLGFSGLVGDYDIVLVADKTETKVGEAINVKVRIEGNGHLGSLEKLAIKWPDSFELYEDKSSTQFNKTGYSERLFEYMIIPKSRGSYEIPSVEISMFNPQTKQYQVRRSQPLKVEVADGVLGQIYQAQTPAGQAPAPKQNQEIRDLKTASQKKIIFTVLRIAAIGVALGVIAFIILRIRKKLERTLLIRDRKKSEIRSRVQKLKGHSSQDFHFILQEVESVLIEELEYLLQTDLKSLTRTQLAEFVKEKKKLDDNTISRILKLLEVCSNIRYSNSPMSSSESTAIVSELEALTGQLLR